MTTHTKTQPRTLAHTIAAMRASLTPRERELLDARSATRRFSATTVNLQSIAKRAFPEHDKLRQAKVGRELITSFLDFAARDCAEEGRPLGNSIEARLRERLDAFFPIDEDALEREKAAMRATYERLGEDLVSTPGAEVERVEIDADWPPPAFCNRCERAECVCEPT